MIVLWFSLAMGAQGVWAFFAPRSFFWDFPLPGFGWVSTLGDFNDHLMRDFGAALVGIALVGTSTALRRQPIRSLLLGYVAFGSLHLGYHLTTGGEFGTASFATQTVVLTAVVIIPAVLLRAIEREEQ